MFVIISQHVMLRLVEQYCKIFTANHRAIHLSRILECQDEKKKKNYKRKVKETVELISLIGTDGKILGLKPKTDSEKLANKLNLVLQKVEDATNGRNYAVYKLTSSSEFFKEEVIPSSKKIVKKLPLNSKISENDLKIKFQTIEKWLSKNCEVHIAVMGKDDTNYMRQSILKKSEEYFKGKSRLIDIRNREEALKFILIPPKKTSEESTVKLPVAQNSEPDEEKLK